MSEAMSGRVLFIGRAKQAQRSNLTLENRLSIVGTFTSRPLELSSQTTSSKTWNVSMHILASAWSLYLLVMES